MNDLDFPKFEADMKSQGFDEVVVREWGPSTVAAPHSHPFTAKAIVVRGEMWLTVGDDVKHIPTGAGFDLERGVLHSERYGAEGATYWVGRRN